MSVYLSLRLCVCPCSALKQTLGCTRVSLYWLVRNGKGGKLCVPSVCVLKLFLVGDYWFIETCSSFLLVSSVTASRANTSH